MACWTTVGARSAADTVVRAGHVTADLRLEAAAVTAPSMVDIGVDLGRAPFVNDYAIGDTDAVVLVAGVLLGLLALAFRAGSRLQWEGQDPV